MKVRTDYLEILLAYKSGEPTLDISRRFGCSKSYVSTLVDRYGKKHGIERRKVLRPDYLDIILAYRDGGTAQSIGDRFACTASYVSYLVKNYGAQHGVSLRRTRVVCRRPAAGIRVNLHAARGCEAAALVPKTIAPVSLAPLQWRGEAP